MPITPRMRAPANDSRSGRMRGTPPATDASNRRSTPAPSAVSKSSRPWVAISSLFAVTTGFPLIKASTMRVRAGSMPPITSTTMSTSGSPTTAAASSVKHRVGRGRLRSLSRWATATCATSSGTPARDSITSAWSWIRRTSAPPTWPQPRIPTRTRSYMTISLPQTLPRRGRGGRRAARGGPRSGRRRAYEQDRGARDEVVVRRHRVAVRTRDRRGEHVADRDVDGDMRVAHQQVALLAVLAGHRDHQRARRVGARRNGRLVRGAVGGGARFVAHAAVDRDVRAHAREVLDGPDGVEGEAGGRGDGPSRLDGERGHRVEAGAGAGGRVGVAQHGAELRDRRRVEVVGGVGHAEAAAEGDLVDRGAGVARHPGGQVRDDRGGGPRRLRHEELRPRGAGGTRGG